MRVNGATCRPQIFQHRRAIRRSPPANLASWYNKFATKNTERIKRRPCRAMFRRVFLFYYMHADDYRRPRKKKSTKCVFPTYIILRIAQFLASWCACKCWRVCIQGTIIYKTFFSVPRCSSTARRTAESVEAHWLASEKGFDKAFYSMRVPFA